MIENITFNEDNKRFKEIIMPILFSELDNKKELYSPTLIELEVICNAIISKFKDLFYSATIEIFKDFVRHEFNGWIDALSDIENTELNS